MLQNVPKSSLLQIHKTKNHAMFDFQMKIVWCISSAERLISAARATGKKSCTLKDLGCFHRGTSQSGTTAWADGTARTRSSKGTCLLCVKSKQLWREDQKEETSYYTEKLLTYLIWWQFCCIMLQGLHRVPQRVWSKMLSDLEGQ